MKDHKLELDPLIVAAIGGCILTRASGKVAFNKNKRGTTTTDIIHSIAEAFDNIFDSNI